MLFFGENENVWANVKSYYLTEYQGQVDAETISVKISKLHQGAIEFAVNFGGICLQLVYIQFKVTGQEASGNGNNHKNCNSNKDNWKCRYCNTPGHLQAKCQKCQSANTPCHSVLE